MKNPLTVYRNVPAQKWKFEIGINYTFNIFFEKLNPNNDNKRMGAKVSRLIGNMGSTEQCILPINTKQITIVPKYELTNGVIIAFSGNPGAGKDTACEILREYYAKFGVPVLITRFAAEIYKIHDAILTGTTWDESNYPAKFVKDVNEYGAKFVKDVNEYGAKYRGTLTKKERDLLNFIGTCGREHDEDFWIKHTQKNIDTFIFKHPNAIILIADLRFVNEYQWVAKWPRHAMFHIIREKHDEQTTGDLTSINHRTEITNSGDTFKRDLINHISIAL